jgi:hypothetical protein
MNRYYYLILFFLVNSSVIAQTTDTVEAKKTHLSLATIYSSNVNFYGQTASSPQPYVLGNASLSFPTGISLSAQTYKLLNSVESGLSATTLTLGYDVDLSKKLAAGFSYSHSFYPQNSELLQSANADFISAALSYNGSFLTTALSGDYSPGPENVFYSTLSLSKDIDLGISFSSKDYFSIKPSVEVVGGTQRFNDTVFTKLPPNAPLKKVKDIITGGNNRNAKVVSSTTFNVLTYNFTLPLAYNRANYSVEASYQGALASKAVSDSRRIQSFFNLGFYYIF